MGQMTTSNKGKDLIKEAEGLRLEAYLCPAKVPTIGWGHTKGVKLGQHITREQAEQLLEQDLKPAERLLNTMGIQFRQGQFDALASWIFNLGTGRFVGSTLCKRIQEGAADEAVAREIVKWIYSGGRPLSGLMVRRVREANMYMGREAYKIANNKIVKL